MAALTNIRKLGKQIVLCKNNYTKLSIRCVYQKDTLDYWKPGKYPKTDEEKRKAAEKYGMHPDEYQPLPETYAFKSDYPDLPTIGDALKDPHYPWDYPVLKRMANEPIHQHYQMMTVDKIDYGTEYLIEPAYGAMQMILGIIIAAFCLTFVDTYVHRGELGVKQYPKEGVVHYTFEPAE